MVTLASQSSSRRHMSAVSMFFLGILAILLIGGGTIASLWAMGIATWPSLNTATGPDHTGKVAVLMAGQNIPAYTRITRDHLINPETKEAANFWLAPEQIPPGVKLTIAEIAGRVLKHDKRMGFFFTEDDFLPPGTRPGLVAGIPVGKRSVTLDATKIGGVAGLLAGDRFDIVASVKVSTKSNQTAAQRGPFVVPTSPAEKHQALVKVVVENGAVVLPVYLRAVPTTTQSMSGAQSSAKPVQEIVLAIEPQEVPLLSEMLASDAVLTAVARSGLPDDKQESRVSIEVTPEPPAKVIDVIQGNKRDQVILPTTDRTAT